MAEGRLKKLSDTKRIKRDRVSLSEPYFYYLDKKPGQVEHRLGVNWGYVWIRQTLPSWEKLHSFDWEVKYKNLRADGFCATKNFASNSLRFRYIEFDIAESGNPFDKVSKYTDLFLSRQYESEWWAPIATGFPDIIIITTGNPRRIEDRIAKENREGLGFQVYTLDRIKEECYHGRNS